MTGTVAGEVAFFDIGDTLATVSRSGPGDPTVRLTVLPDVPAVLAALRQRGVRLGIISDPGPIPAADVNQALVAAGLWDFFTPHLVIYGKKNSSRIFVLAAQEARSSGAVRCLLFVGEDPRERGFAQEAGFLATADPRDAVAVLDHACASREV